ncbi:hypothetical protein REPUB_Repub14bG0005700 [Reevesia pubescens]
MTKYSLIIISFLLIPISISGLIGKHQHRPLPPPQSPLHHHQLNNIIDALIGAGDFNNWANMLSASADLLMLPLSATLFVPSDHVALFPFPDPLPTSSTATATSAFAFDPLVVPYHIVPQRLTFSQLTLFQPFSRLPTLLPSESILITNTSHSNFTLDNSQISYPDLYLTSAIAVHGIAALLKYTVYGRDAGGLNAHGLAPPPPPPPPSPVFEPLGGVMGDYRARTSDAAGSFLGWGVCICFLLIPWVVWGIKIYGNMA